MVVVWSAACVSRAKASAPHGLLCSFYFVPDLVVLGAARDILPKIKPLLVIVHVIKVQALHFFRSHELRSMWIRRRVAGHVGDFFLRLRLDHEFEKLVGE